MRNRRSSFKLMKKMMILSPLLILAACNNQGEEAAVPDAVSGTFEMLRADIKNSEGESIGEAIIGNDNGTLLLDMTVSTLTPGSHGFHIHTIGSCEAPDFKSAGGHWNPLNAEHGIENPNGSHAGDLPNLNVDENGNATLVQFSLGDIASGEAGTLIDEDGGAIVIHADADDLSSDPAGNAGARVACGVLENISSGK